MSEEIKMIFDRRTSFDFSKRGLRDVPHRDKIQIKKAIKKYSFSHLKPRPKFCPRFLWIYLIQKIHNVTKKQLKTIR